MSLRQYETAARFISSNKHLMDSPETGLIYMKSRYYDASLCRFISADTMGVRLINPQTMNRYSYVINDLVNFLDPDGHEGESVFSSNNDMDSWDQLQFVLNMPMDSYSDLIGDYNTLDTSYNSQMNDVSALNDSVNAIEPSGLCAKSGSWSLNSITGGGTFVGQDFSYEYYNAETGAFKSTETDTSLSTTLVGGGLQMVFDTPIPRTSLLGTTGFILSHPSLSKYLGITYNPESGQLSINIGLGIGLPYINLSVPLY